MASTGSPKPRDSRKNVRNSQYNRSMSGPERSWKMRKYLEEKEKRKGKGKLKRRKQRQWRVEKEKEAERRRKQEASSKVARLAGKQANRKRQEAVFLQPRIHDEDSSTSFVPQMV